jgi:cysteine synthase A
LLHGVNGDGNSCNEFALPLFSIAIGRNVVLKSEELLKKSPLSPASRLFRPEGFKIAAKPSSFVTYLQDCPMSNSVIDVIGNTPLIRLRRASEETGCEILGKAEFMNPGQSVKDRAGLFIIRDAEKRGLLRPGGVIVEGTAGNTGIGLTVVAKALGYRTVIVIPDTQSQEKKDALRLLGAELIEVPAVPYKNPNNYVKVSGRLAAQLARTEPNGAIWANQFDNVANRDGHIVTTAQEIWNQTQGKVDGFVSAVGTGGTLAGIAFGLKDKNKDVRIGLADPMGAALYSFYTDGVLKSEGSSITEGIGQGRITANLEGFTPDAAFQIHDSEALPIVFDLVQEEGLCVGGSTGVNIAGAIRLARQLGPGHTVVTILADYGTRYQSKLFNPEFLRTKDLPVPQWLDQTPSIDVPFEDAA